MKVRLAIRFILPVALVMAWTLAGCSSGDDDEAAAATNDSASSGFTLTSSAFKNGGEIPGEYGCQGDRNHKKPSPPLEWTGAPSGTKSFVLVMDDLAEEAGGWVHWVVADIPATVTLLAKGASGKSMPSGAKELTNSWNEKAYGGPCPPNPPHTYRFQLFAMPTETTALETSGKKGPKIIDQLAAALGTAKLEGVFK